MTTNNLLKKHIPEDLLQQWKEITSQKQSSKVRIANFGLLKAGKSMLFNCLSDSVDNSDFATGSVRTTVKPKELELDNYILVDTPGLDCTDHDSDQTFKVLKGADIAIFVHNIKSGELDRIERKFLENIAKNWDEVSVFINRTFWVMTHLDEQECSDSVKIYQAVRQQICDIFNHDVEMFSVASPRYQKGKAENKKLLLAKSNVPQFREALDQKIVTDAEAVISDRNNKKENCHKQITKVIRDKITEANKNISKCQSQSSKKRQQLSDQLSNLIEQTKRSVETYNSI